MPEKADRAIIQGTGTLYIQTGLFTSDAILYGPYRVTPGEPLEIVDIPAGVYPFLALVYADGPKLDSNPIVITTGTNPDAEFHAALVAAVGDPSLFSYRVLKNVQIVSGQVNTIKTSLIPITNIVYNGTITGAKIVYPVLPATGSELARKFVRIDNVGAGVPPLGTAIKALRFFVETSASSAQFGRLDIFRGDGTLRAASGLPSQVLAPASSIIPVIFNYSGDNQYYAYVEYSGTTVSLAQNYDFTTNLVAVSTDGSARISLDGITWSGPHPTGLFPCYAVTYGGSGLFVAVGKFGASYGIATSNDGITWTPRTLPGAPPTALLKVRANPAGQLLAISNTGPSYAAYTSNDGINWTGPVTVYTSTTPVWFSGKWYMSNSNGTSFYSSPDGVVWSLAGGVGLSMYQMNTLGAVGGTLIAGGGAPVNATKQVQRSSNSGANFGSPISFATHSIYAFATTSTNRLISVGSGLTEQVNWSDDNGVTWTPSTVPVATTVQAVCSTPMGIFIGADDLSIYRSTDNGATFNLAGGTATAAVIDIAWRWF